MNRNELYNKLITYYGEKRLGGQPTEDITPTFKDIIAVLAEETPEYSFALREDLKNDKRFLPIKAEPFATGYDVRAAQEDRKPIIVKPFQYLMIPLGFRAFCPNGWWLKLHPRSSTFGKKNLHSLYGVIDEQFEGQMIFSCQYLPSQSIKTDYNLTINFGDAIGQLIPVRRQEMKVVEWSNEIYDNACRERNGQRGAGGFGSTNK